MIKDVEITMLNVQGQDAVYTCQSLASLFMLFLISHAIITAFASIYCILFLGTRLRVFTDSLI